MLKYNQKGFSLVELIIAIAVLAILSLPLLGYFSGAAINTSKGKFIQEGEMAAQSIIEEINSYNYYEQLTRAIADGTCAFSVDAPDAGTQRYFARDISVDGINMISKITVDFAYDNTGSSVEYNEYEVPNLKALYTSRNAVAIQNASETENAVNAFYQRYSGIYTKAHIRGALDRKAIINIGVNVLDTTLVDIHVYYMYTYNGESLDASPVLKTQMLKDDFSNVYLLYNLYRNDVITELVEVNMSGFTSEEASQINCYFICQKPTSGITKPAGYNINVNGSGQYLYAFYRTNEISVNMPNSDITYIEKKKKERIAKVTVDIYNEGEVTFDESTRVLRLESAKGE